MRERLRLSLDTSLSTELEFTPEIREALHAGYHCCHALKWLYVRSVFAIETTDQLIDLLGAGRLEEVIAKARPRIQRAKDALMRARPRGGFPEACGERSETACHLALEIAQRVWDKLDLLRAEIATYECEWTDEIHYQILADIALRLPTDKDLKELKRLLDDEAYCAAGGPYVWHDSSANDLYDFMATTRFRPQGKERLKSRLAERGLIVLDANDANRFRFTTKQMQDAFLSWALS